jgi:hypothetical protein
MRFRRGLIGISPLMLAFGSLWLGHAYAVAGFHQPDAKASDTAFLVKPYLQLGDVSPANVATDLVLLWHADDGETPWAVEYQPRTNETWHMAMPPASHRIVVPGVAPHRLFRANLTNLIPGSEFGYRVRKGNEIVFAAQARAPKGASQPYRFVSFGDCGAGTAAQKMVAHQTYLARPDFLMITGDIVYSRGRISEYREKFWPAYNADNSSPLVGAPLLRSTLFVAAPGNHDIATKDLEKYPDGLAYFLYWDQPRNGPKSAGARPLVPPLTGPAGNTAAFMEAAGEAYPRMANFSFNYGNSHWTIIDSNPYVDWTDPKLRAWVERDLAAAQNQTWRFVAFHHPGFNSSKAHFDDQQMRLLADVLERGRVDVVFNGHVHNYQRSFPIRFTSETGTDGKPVRDKNKVPGRWVLDRVFDGRNNTRPQGVIYLVTGAGGNTLYNPEQQEDRSSWQSFTQKFISKVHSLTVADVNGTTLSVRQVAGDGAEVDRFTITK